MASISTSDSPRPLSTVTESTAAPVADNVDDAARLSLRRHPRYEISALQAFSRQNSTASTLRSPRSPVEPGRDEARGRNTDRSSLSASGSRRGGFETAVSRRSHSAPPALPASRRAMLAEIGADNSPFLTDAEQAVRDELRSYTPETPVTSSCSPIRTRTLTMSLPTRSASNSQKTAFYA